MQDPPVAQPSISSGDPSKPVDNLTERSSVARHRSRAMQDNISRLTLHLLHKQIKRWYPKSLVRQVVSEDSDTVSVRTLVDVLGDSSAGHQLEEKTKELSALCDVSHQMASQALLRYKDDLLVCAAPLSTSSCRFFGVVSIFSAHLCSYKSIALHSNIHSRLCYHYCCKLWCKFLCMVDSHLCSPVCFLFSLGCDDE